MRFPDRVTGCRRRIVILAARGAGVKHLRVWEGDVRKKGSRKGAKRKGLAKTTMPDVVLPQGRIDCDTEPR